MLESSGNRRISRVTREIFIVHRSDQAAPIVIVAADDCDPIVVAGGWINTVRREDGVKIPDASVDAAVHRVVENRRPEKLNRAFSLRLIDVLPLPGAAPMIKRSENRDRSKSRRHVVGVRAED